MPKQQLNEHARWKRNATANFAAYGVKRYKQYRRMPCGHTTNIYDRKAGVCFVCRVKERLRNQVA